MVSNYYSTVKVAFPTFSSSSTLTRIHSSCERDKGSIIFFQKFSRKTLILKCERFSLFCSWETSYELSDTWILQDKREGASLLYWRLYSLSISSFYLNVQ